MRRIATLLIVISALTACVAGTSNIAASVPTAEEIKKAKEEVIRYAIERIPGGYASKQLGNVKIEATVRHIFYDGIASFMFRSNPCYNILIRVESDSKDFTV